MQHWVAPIFLQQVGDAHLQDYQAVTNTQNTSPSWQEPLSEYQSAWLWLPSSGTWQQSPTIIRVIQPSLLPGATAQSSSKSCVEITRTKEAAGGSSWLHHIFPQNNLLCSCEEENLIWLQTNISRGDGMWSQAERLSWIIYGSQWMDNFPKLITLQPELFCYFKSNKAHLLLLPRMVSTELPGR